jgi:antirestriction protein ArdC
MLRAEAVDKGYCSPAWMTFHHANELKGHLQKGEITATSSSMPTQLRIARRGTVRRRKRKFIS